MQQTSILSYEAIKPRMSELQKTVFEAIKRTGGLTDKEIMHTTGIESNTSRPRRIELHKQGLIRVGGYKTQSNGRKATLWVIN